MSPRIGGLFEGYGGLTTGVQAVFGGELAWYSEFDKGANKILAHHYPNVPNHGDITKIDWSTVEPVDILTGGSPCQDLSHAGKRSGMTEGTRSNLWVAMREAIAQLRPSLVIWENVRGAYSAAADSDVEPCPGCVGDGPGVHLRALGRVLGDLSDLGYDASWHGLRAADIGAPHGRFRVFVVAHASGVRRGAWWPTVTRETQGGWTPADLAGRGLLPTPRATRGGSNTETTNLLGTPRSSEWKGSGPVGSKSHAHMLERDYLSAQVLSLLPTPSVADTTGGRKHRSGDRSDELLLNGIAAAEQWGPYADAIARWETLTRPAPSPTEWTGKATPRLSPRFSEWLMGLPAGWVTDVPGITRNEALKALGNGVVPQQAEAALRHLLTATEVAA